MKKFLLCLGAATLASLSIQAQILLSGGLSYSQNFDTLATDTGTGTTTPWTDNSTLLGWYASRAILTSGGAYGPTAYTSYRVSAGENNSGWIFSYGSFGTNASYGPMTDRAFGTISSGSTGTNSIGLRIRNDTAQAVGNIQLGYTGEQWRQGGNTAAQKLYFTYSVSSSPFGSPISALSADPNFTSFSALDFITPTVGTGTTASILDGNDPANRIALSSLLDGIVLNPGDEILLRWYDVNDQGNDHGFGIDDLSVTFSVVPEPSTAALAGLGLAALAIFRRRR